MRRPFMKYSLVDKQFDILELLNTMEGVEEIEVQKDGAILIKKANNYAIEGLLVYPKIQTAAERDEVRGELLSEIDEKYEGYKRYGATQLLQALKGYTKDEAKNKARKLIDNQYKEVEEDDEVVFGGEVKEINGCYITKDRAISNFTMQVKEYIKCVDDESYDSYRIGFQIAKGEYFERIFQATDFLKVDTFRKKLANPKCSFTGGFNHFEEIKIQTLNKDYQEIKAVSYGGMVCEGNKWYFVDQDVCLDTEGNISKHLHVAESKREIVTNLLEAKVLTKEELRSITPHLLAFNDKAVVYSVLGYGCAVFLTERMKRHGKFGHLLISGEAGCGKSETVDTILANLWGLNRSTAATRITKYVLDLSMGSNNTLPLVLNEYKPNMMQEWRVRLISDGMRNSYDGYTRRRGNVDMSITTTQPRNSMVLIGESSTTETAVLERCTVTTMSKTKSLQPGKTESYKYLKANRGLLAKLGRTLLLGALQISDEFIDATFNEVYKKVSKKVITERMALSTTNVSMGFVLLKSVYEAFGVEPPFNINEVVDVLCDATIQEIGKESLSIVELTLSEMDNMLSLNSTGALYYRNLSQGTELALRLETFYTVFLKYVADYRINGDWISKNDFAKQLRNHKSFKEKRTVKFSNLEEETKGYTCYILDTSKLGKLENFTD